MFRLQLSQSAEVRVHGAPASGHHSSHQGPAFLYKLGFLIKSTSLQGAPGAGLHVRKWEQLMGLSDEK